MKKPQMMTSQADYDHTKTDQHIEKLYLNYMNQTNKPYLNVVVTGGSGFLGRRLKESQPGWAYLSSADCDLAVSGEFTNVLQKYKPDAIVHLAAKVGGIKDNVEKQAEYYNLNTRINLNVLHESYVFGISRLLAALSTCAFPNEIDNFPYNEEDFFNGPPTVTNFSYGMSKRHLHTGCIAYRKQYGVNYSTFCPSNLYGPGDHFGEENSHFVASLVHKYTNACDNEVIELWGTGTPLRQQLYVDDMCEIIPILLEKHNTDVPLIVAPDENLSINEMANILIKQLDKNIKIVYNNQLDGQFRKDGSNLMLKKMINNLKFTKFKKGIMETYNWYERTL